MPDSPPLTYDNILESLSSGIPRDSLSQRARSLSPQRMDPFIALGAAAAIVQLVGVATQITREAYSLVTGARESTRKQISLACLNDNDSKLCQDLLESLNARRPLDKNEALLYEVVETYKERVGALRSLLQTLVVRKSANGTKSIAQALKVVIKVEIIKRREIGDLAKAVEEARDQLSNMLLFLLQLVLHLLLRRSIG